ncbi:MAG TPA: GspE/PulE family protein [Candidatus Paceibacterota bacterium]|nr:GspE/PulE family protein [Candidatus Paceibacterota bacterium]
MSFLQFLSQKQIIEETIIPELTQESERTKGGLDEVLARGGMTQEQVLALKAEYYGLEFRILGDIKVPVSVLRDIPEESARHYFVVPLAVVDSVLEVGIVDPDFTQARDAVQFIAAKLGMPFRLYVITQPDFNTVVEQYKNLTGEVTKALSELDMEKTEGVEFSSGSAAEEGVGGGEGEEKIVEEAPVTKIVAVLLRHAVEGNASDVHIEHMGERVRVRFRVDGAMYTSIILPTNIHSAVVARIKILAQLKLDEKRKPQDGRFSVKMDDRRVDFRVSTFPAYFGEKVVMRILDSSRGIRPLDQIGLDKTRENELRNVLAMPYGLILVTGPTGSGKTTTLYTMLGELDREKYNVVSLEDPVEYSMQGVSQSQVRPEIGYTFANGLRSILRQDPDIIMVGEIRDKETAQLAIQAALTGHLVFSTLHTNTAAGAIPRLIDMGVDPYLIAPTLALVVGQRLLRTLCDDGKTALPMTESQRIMAEKQFADLPAEIRAQITIPSYVYNATPSAACPTGTKGRIPVFEFLRLDKDIEHVILTKPEEQAIYDIARRKGMITMKDDALIKAFQGVIPFEEINNII